MDRGDLQPGTVLVWRVGRHPGHRFEIIAVGDRMVEYRPLGNYGAAGRKSARHQLALGMVLASAEVVRQPRQRRTA